VAPRVGRRADRAREAGEAGRGTPTSTLAPGRRPRSPSGLSLARPAVPLPLRARRASCSRTLRARPPCSRQLRSSRLVAGAGAPWDHEPGAAKCRLSAAEDEFCITELGPAAGAVVVPLGRPDPCTVGAERRRATRSLRSSNVRPGARGPGRGTAGLASARRPDDRGAPPGASAEVGVPGPASAVHRAGSARRPTRGATARATRAGPIVQRDRDRDRDRGPDTSRGTIGLQRYGVRASSLTIQLPCRWMSASRRAINRVVINP